MGLGLKGRGLLPPALIGGHGWAPGWAPGCLPAQRRGGHVHTHGPSETLHAGERCWGRVARMLHIGMNGMLHKFVTGY